MSSLNHRKTLVLNKNWEPIGLILSTRAISLTFSVYSDNTPKAKIIDVENDFQVFSWDEWSKIPVRRLQDSISTSSSRFNIPEVIILTKYDKIPIKRNDFSKRCLFKRDLNQCQYCSLKFDSYKLTIDHVIPRSLGGKTNWSNCVTCCQKCNSQKADRLLQDCRKEFYPRKYNWHGPSPMKLLKIPVKPVFDNFKVNPINLRESWLFFLKKINIDD